MFWYKKTAMVISPRSWVNESTGLKVWGIKKVCFF